MGCFEMIHLCEMKVGDWVWTVQEGWVRVKEINKDASASFAIGTEENWFTREGRLSVHDKYPSLFLTPPAGFDAEPKPCEFKDGDRVSVRDNSLDEWKRAYFLEYTDNNTPSYRCYAYDKWLSDGATENWCYCKKWEGEESGA